MRVLVTGGYGFFGRRLVERLCRHDGLDIVVAGRSLAGAQALVRSLAPRAGTTLSAAALDVMDDSFAARLREHRPAVVVHTCGPFQAQDYRVAAACIEGRVHYIDLADARAFVCGIGALDARARDHGTLVVSGASSVPALSGAAADRLSDGLAAVDRIDIGICPGNRAEPGLATMQAVLSYCGKPLPGETPPRFGWWGSWRFDYPAPVGARLLSPCDVPDLELLPPRYAGRPVVRFGAGLELRMLQRGMNLMAGLVRAGLVRDWSVHARRLKPLLDALRRFGSDAGAMHVRIEGRTPSGESATRTWLLLAVNGDGPYVPTLAAAALVRKLAAGELVARGAAPCVGQLDLDEFAREAQGLAIMMTGTLAP